MVIEPFLPVKDARQVTKNFPIPFQLILISGNTLNNVKLNGNSTKCAGVKVSVNIEEKSRQVTINNHVTTANKASKNGQTSNPTVTLNNAIPEEAPASNGSKSGECSINGERNNAVL